MSLYVKKLNAQFPAGAGQCDPEKGRPPLTFYLVAYDLHRASRYSSCDCVVEPGHPLSLSYCPPPWRVTVHNRPQLRRLGFFRQAVFSLWMIPNIPDCSGFDTPDLIIKIVPASRVPCSLGI